MEKYLASGNDTVRELQEKYNDCTFHFRIYSINVAISVFFVQAKFEILEKDETWMKISEEIALRYQPKLESIYDKWNLYIIYLSTNKIPKDLKNRIENDKFSSRKIVEGIESGAFNQDVADQLVIKHITNSDLKVLVDETNAVTIDEYKPYDDYLWALVNNDEKIIGDRELQELIIDKLSQDEN